MSSNTPNSPRQKMINLMYLVFIAMLALNVSSEVLEGFELVEESLLRSVKASTQHNDRIFNDLKAYYQTNPEKTRVWYGSASKVKAKSDSLFNYIQELKNRIVIKADGENGNPEHLKHPDDLNAAYEVMFERGKNDAVKLKSDINAYREYVASLVSNLSIKNIIESNLSTEPSVKAKENKQTWEESMFLQMPLAASVTLLTKIQNDIRYAEGEVLSDLVKNIDIEDFRVNKIEAFVIPESHIVMRGGTYRADIVLSAQDSTQRPKIFVNGRLLPEDAGGQYMAGAGSAGIFQVNGYIEVARSNGSFMRHDFSSQYFVVEPSATIAPVWMNVLYAGIANEVRIAVPGVAGQNVSASISNGTLTYKGNDIWIATPKYGSDAVITVMAKMTNGHTQEMAKNTFRVRQLPDPTAYLEITNADGNKVRYKGGTPLAKAALVNVEALSAAIDDGILDRPFTVLRFELQKFDAMGFAITTSSEGARFSQQQKNMIRGMQRGQTLLIRGIVVRGPDLIERTLNAPMEIRIN
ncbi:MAG: gliding motility protein GldM [Dysgonamonadaceae bacterium]|jgi:gliding motility-associated protein GldM|nr:gliding motility protein GldM [Dysgonamonadaceae bacterium]